MTLQEIDWTKLPANMPQEPILELIAAYCTPDVPAVQVSRQAGPTIEDDYVWLKIGIRRTKHSDGWDLKCGDDKVQDVSGITAEAFMHEQCSEHLEALQSIIDQAEPMTEPDEPDYELESDRHSGTPEHRSIG